MIVRLLRAYRLNTGKLMPVGSVFNRMPKEALRMINYKIAEEYKGKYPPKKMKTEIFKPKQQWQQLES
jgi:hypothetical protein